MTSKYGHREFGGSSELSDSSWKDLQREVKAFSIWSWSRGSFTTVLGKEWLLSDLHLFHVKHVHKPDLNYSTKDSESHE